MDTILVQDERQNPGVFYTHVAELLRLICAESNLTGLLRRFAEILAHNFHVHTFSCLETRLRGGRLVFKNLDLAAHQESGIKSFREPVLAKVQGQLSVLLQNHWELSEPWGLLSYTEEGNGLLQDQEQSLHWLFLGSLKSGGLLCLWDAVAESQRPELDFCVQLLQNESSWYRKLDHTQALLYVDELTGLFNYRYLDVALDSELRRASRYQQNFSLLFIDLDDFKQINDRHGHMIGSQLLKQVGGVLQEELREVDTIIRYGGDEYVVILLGAGVATAAQVAERIRRRMATVRFQIERVLLQVTCSVGVACFPEHGNNKEELLRLADETMYVSKRQGKNRVMTVGGRDLAMQP